MKISEWIERERQYRREIGIRNVLLVRHYFRCAFIEMERINKLDKGYFWTGVGELMTYGSEAEVETFFSLAIALAEIDERKPAP